MIRRAPLLALLAAVLLAAAFFVLVYRPLQAQQDALEAETAQLEARQAELDAQLALYAELAERQVQIRADLARLESLIPSNTAQPSLIRSLQLQADSSGVVINSVTFGDPLVVAGAPPVGEDGALTEIPLTMIVDGGYVQAVDLFRRLEDDAERAILIDSVSMGESSEASFPVLTTTWTGSVFAVLPLAEVGATDGTAPAPAPESTPEPGATATATPAPTATAAP